MAKTKGEARTNFKEKTPAKAQEDPWVKVEEEAARARVEQEAQVKVEEEARIRAEQEARVTAEAEARAKAEEEARANAQQEAQVKAEEEARVGSESEIANFQETGKEQLKSAITSPTFLATGFRAITAETIEYSKKSLENRSAFVEKLLCAKTFQSAIYVRSEYAKTSYAELVAYLTKIGELNTKLAIEAFKRHSHVA